MEEAQLVVVLVCEELEEPVWEELGVADCVLVCEAV